MFIAILIAVAVAVVGVVNCYFIVAEALAMDDLTNCVVYQLTRLMLTFFLAQICIIACHSS